MGLKQLRRHFLVVLFPHPVRPILLASFINCALLTMATTALLFIIQPVVPLYYSLPRPSDYLVPKVYLMVLPGLAWLFYALNTVLIHTLQGHLEVLYKIWAWLTLVMSLLLSLALFRIVTIIS